MVKAPLPKRVKTRLSPPLTDREAVELYRCFIMDIFARVSVLDGIDVFAAYTPKGKEDIIKQLTGNVYLLPQRGIGLGKRLANLFSDLFARGYKKIVVIGSDSPDMPLEFIRTSFSVLDKDGVVFGPTEDGGYYLVGMNRFCRKIFEDIPWSTNNVLKRSLEICNAEGMDIFLIPKWYDVDTYKDLKMLIKDGSPEAMPNTYRFLAAQAPHFNAGT